jgi:peptidoglycan hydrolase-like protein with peptidoglycan-binding domain
MRKFMTLATVLAVGAMWSLGPAFAQSTTESTKETVKDKAEDAKETLKDKATRAKDTIKEKVTHARDSMRSKSGRAERDTAMTDTRAAQQALKTQGFDPGPIDGRMGPRTRAAVSDYQRKNDLPATGMLDEATLAKLEVRGSRASDVPSASPTTRPDPKKQNP